MRVTIQYWAQARKAAHTGAETIDVDGPCSIGQLLERVAELHGQAMRRIILSADNRPHPSLVLVVGDQQIAHDSAQQLQDGDVLAIIPPIAGG